MKSPSDTPNGTGRNGNAIRSQALRRLRSEERGDAALDRRQLLAALTAFQKGSFDARLPEHWSGIDGKIADAFNAVVKRNQRMSRELERLSRVVGKEGRIDERASLGDVSGSSLIRAIRALPPEGGGAVPALAVTAYAREEDRLRALAAGFQCHVAKPVDPAELVAALALVAAPATPGAGGRPDPAPTSGNGDRSLIRVLVVEDDVDSREGLKNLLEIWGHAVDVARTGREGIEQAIRHRPGVALIDIGLPELDGYQVAQRIREALGPSEIFLVAITGYADARARQQALENGFDAHVAKPIDFSKLSSILAARVGAA